MCVKRQGYCHALVTDYELGIKDSEYMWIVSSVKYTNKKDYSFTLLVKRTKLEVEYSQESQKFWSQFDFQATLRIWRKSAQPLKMSVRNIDYTS